MADHGELPWDDDAFDELQRPCGATRRRVAADALATAADVLAAAARVRGAARADCVAPAVERVGRRRRGPARPAGPRPGSSSRPARAGCPTSHRYVRAIEYRLDRLAEDVGRDLRRMAEVVPLEDALRRHCVSAGRPPRSSTSAGQLEELRVSVFAQPSAPAAR